MKIPYRIVLLALSFIFFTTTVRAQNCWDSLRVEVQHSQCAGSNSGSISVHYYPHIKTNLIFVEISNDLTGDIAMSSNVVGSGGIASVGYLTPARYKVVIRQVASDNSEVCRSLSYPDVLEPGCNVEVNETIINQDPLSANFLKISAKVSGNYCAFGYRNTLYMKINGQEQAYGTVPAGYHQSKEIALGTLLSEVKPGDTVQLAADNGNEAPWNTPTAICRNGGSKLVIENDLEINELQAVRCALDTTIIDITGRVKTKYLQLKNNPVFQYTQWAQVFRLNVYDDAGNLIIYTNIADTSGRFHFYFQRPVPQYHDEKFILKLAAGVLTKEVYIDSIPKHKWVGPLNGNWNEPSNWSCYTVPAANDNVIISSGVVSVDTNTIVKSISVAPGATVHVKPGVTLTIRQQ